MGVAGSQQLQARCASICLLTCMGLVAGAIEIGTSTLVAVMVAMPRHVDLVLKEEALEGLL